MDGRMPETLIPDGPLTDSLFLDGPPSPWPDWLENRRVDDAVVDAAYEGTPPQLRASIKTGLALAFAHFGQREKATDSITSHSRAGFWFGAHTRPAPWCCILMDASYAAAARLAAACVLPRLCDVPEVFAVAVGENAPADNVLTALTLSGVEDVFCLPQPEVSALLEAMATGSEAGAQGRVLLLHNGALDNLARTLRRLHIPYYEEYEAPCLAVLPECACNGELLAFAHGAITPAMSLTAETRAVFAPAPATPQAYASNALVAEAVQRGLLVLTPGCEGFWLHPGLEPSFFTVQGLASGLL